MILPSKAYREPSLTLAWLGYDKLIALDEIENPPYHIKTIKTPLEYKEPLLR